MSNFLTKFFLIILFASEIFFRNESSAEESNNTVSIIQRSELRSFPSIPDGYQLIPGIGALKINRRRVSWNQSRNLCVQEGAHLAVINSLGEEYILRQMAVAAGVSDVIWLGGHDIFQEDDWVTVEDIPLQRAKYVQWGPGQPDGGRSQNCLTLSIRGGLNDDYCNNSRPSACKISVT